VGGFEAQIIANELTNFNYVASSAWRALRSQFSSGIRQHELTSIALLLCSMNESLPLLSRSERRSFPLLIRWFETNWSGVEPFLPAFSLRDENGEVINFERERKETMIRNYRKPP
jgi:hypothetical protein